MAGTDESTELWRHPWIRILTNVSEFLVRSILNVLRWAATWSLLVICFCKLYGIKPVPGSTGLPFTPSQKTNWSFINKISFQGEFLPEPKSMTKFIYHSIFCDVIGGCWRMNPFERKSARVRSYKATFFAEAILHWWISVPHLLMILGYVQISSRLPNLTQPSIGSN